MFTKDNLHHARIEDIVSDLLSRIETLESNRQEIQSTHRSTNLQTVLDSRGWKNSVKDGLPVLKIGDFIMIRKMQGSFSFSDHEIDDETTKEKVYKEFLYGGEFDYFVFNLYENATN